MRRNDITLQNTPEKTEFLLYQSEDGRIRIETRMQNETVWLTQDQMAELFGKAKSTINEHIKNIFTEGELLEAEVMRKFGISEFSTKPNHFYNLDVIISVGYRVKSLRGTQFPIWATQRLREYLIMIQSLKARKSFSKSFKTKCIRRPMAKLLLNLYTNVRMP